MGAGKEGGGYWEHTTKGGRELFLEKRRKGRGIGKEGGGYWEHTTKTDVPFFNVSYYEAQRSYYPINFLLLWGCIGKNSPRYSIS